MEGELCAPLETSDAAARCACAQRDLHALAKLLDPRVSAWCLEQYSSGLTTCTGDEEAGNHAGNDKAGREEDGNLRDDQGLASFAVGLRAMHALLDNPEWTLPAETIRVFHGRVLQYTNFTM